MASMRFVTQYWEIKALSANKNHAYTNTLIIHPCTCYLYYTNAICTGRLLQMTNGRSASLAMFCENTTNIGPIRNTSILDALIVTQ